MQGTTIGYGIGIASLLASFLFSGAVQAQDAEGVDVDAVVTHAPVVAHVEEPSPPTLHTKSDHEQIVGAWGFHIVDVANITTAPAIGLRRWGSIDGGWEAGVAFMVVNVEEVTDVGLGGSFGYMIGLATYQHLTVFVEPEGGVYFFIPDGGDTMFMFNARASFGAEINLGLLELTHIALTTKVSMGLDILNDGSNTTMTLGTIGSENNGLRSVVEGTLGFVVYFD